MAPQCPHPQLLRDLTVALGPQGSLIPVPGASSFLTFPTNSHLLPASRLPAPADPTLIHPRYGGEWSPTHPMRPLAQPQVHPHCLGPLHS